MLKQRGLRMTPQRQLILEAIAASEGHMSAEGLYQQVAPRFPDVNISTVYRTLEVLEELGLLRHTHFHAGVARYHLATEREHQHLVCRRCGRETELDLDVLRPLGDALQRRYGFAADLTHTAIVGTCQTCQTAEELCGARSRRACTSHPQGLSPGTPKGALLVEVADLRRVEPGGAATSLAGAEVAADGRGRERDQEDCGGGEDDRST